MVNPGNDVVHEVDQLPMNVGDKHYDHLFPFGFGLTLNFTKLNTQMQRLIWFIAEIWIIFIAVM
ncbi:transmembrane protein, putative [Medicago truncatula]|uniref:Transmembrane protein, putative n=1 Tax=Medicago truncatula TaxID=3880 RepID=G7J6M0_MEDTR|nr:transmembrane protein, putative [Medicago truncatula]